MAAAPLQLANLLNLATGQDYFFLHGFEDAYKKAGELAAAKGDAEGVKKFATLAEGVQEELVLHKVRADDAHTEEKLFMTRDQRF